MLNWTSSPFCAGWEEEEPDVVLWVDVQRFDHVWKASGEWIGPGGTGGLDDRYSRFGRWIRGAAAIEMPTIWIEEKMVGFTNGRHRFAWLRDHGVLALPVQLNPASLAVGDRRFGTDLRTSILAERGRN